MRMKFNQVMTDMIITTLLHFNYFVNGIGRCIDLEQYHSEKAAQIKAVMFTQVTNKIFIYL